MLVGNWLLAKYLRTCILLDIEFTTVGNNTKRRDSETKFWIP